MAPSTEQREAPEHRCLSACFAVRQVVQQHGHQQFRDHLEVPAVMAFAVMHDLTRAHGAFQPLRAEGVVLAASRSGIGAAAVRRRHGFPFCHLRAR